MSDELYDAVGNVMRAYIAMLGYLVRLKESDPEAWQAIQDAAEVRT
jgi:hypothetical protein